MSYNFVSRGRVKSGKELQMRLRKNKALELKRITSINQAYKNPEYHKKLSNIKKAQYESLKERKKTGRALSKWWKEHPEIRTEYSRRKKEYFIQHPEERKNISKIMKIIMASPSARKNIDRKLTELWKNHPYLKEQKSKEVTNYYLKNPLAVKDLMNYSKKSTKHHIRTKSGYLVMSKGEKIISDFLFDHHIEAEYESRFLKFPEMMCIPDFYLPKQKVYIEFYGGNPHAWKKKVKKKKIYAKYHTPVIAITPAELNDLRELKEFIH